MTISTQPSTRDVLGHRFGTSRTAAASPLARFGPRLYSGVLVVFAALYALAFFQGLELHGGYRGNSFEAIHPESFSGDRYLTGTHPTMLSLMYVVAHLVGELWLDDRFQLALQLGLVMLAIAAVDRLAVLFGASTYLERLTILALVLVAHHFKTNFAQLVPSSGTPTAVVHPIGLWVAYLLFRGNRTFAAMALGGLMVLIAPKNGWYPVMMALSFWLRERWHVPWKWIVLGLALSLVTLFVGFALINGGNREAVVLFHLWDWYEDGEPNPFRDSLAGNGLYLLLLLGAIGVISGRGTLQARGRVFFGVALVVFFLGGMYYTYAPDVMKIPILQGISVNRTSWWPQQLSYIILGCSTIRLFDRGTRSAKILSAVLLGALYLTPVFEARSVDVSPFFVKRAVLLLGLWGLLALVFMTMRATKLSPRSNAVLLLLPIVLTTTVYLLRCVHTQWPSLQFLMAHGVMGNSSSAKWVGVDDYLRDRTPATASFLALSRDRRGTYGADDTLRVRTGRSTPVSRPVAAYLSCEKASRFVEQQWLWEDLARRWDQHDWPGVSKRLAALGSPDYLVVPADDSQWIDGIPDIEYRIKATIRGFTILQRDGHAAS